MKTTTALLVLFAVLVGLVLVVVTTDRPAPPTRRMAQATPEPTPPPVARETPLARPEGEPVAVVPASTQAPVVAQGIDLSVYVEDRTGQPLSGCRVSAAPRAFSTEGRSSAATDTDRAGHCRFAALAAGAYTVICEHTAHARHVESPVLLREGMTEAAVRVRLAPGAVLSGSVTTTVGRAPVAGADIACRRADGTAEPAFQTVTDASGGFALRGLSLQTTYTLRVIARGYQEKVIEPLVLAEDRTIAVTLVPGGTVTGRVVLRETGEPVPAADVVAQGLGTSPRGSITDASGTYEIAGLAPGRYRLTALRGSLMTPPESAVSCELSGIETRRAADLRLVPGAALRVRTADVRRGAPLAGAAVTVEVHPSRGGAQPPAQRTASTDDDGLALLAGLPQGRAQVSACRDGYACAYVGEDAGPTLQYGATAELTLSLLQGGALAGRVVDVSDHAIPGARLALEPMRADVAPSLLARTPYAAVADGQGAFRFEDLPLGRVRLAVRAEGYTPAADKVVEVPDEDLRIVLLAEGTGTGTVSGRVLDAWGGRPVTAFAGTLARQGWSGLEHAEPVSFQDPQGWFLFSGVEPGNWRVLVTDQQGREATSPPFFLLEGQSVDGIVLVLEESGSLSGKVVSQAQQPVPNASITAVASSGGERTTQADTQGRFAFERLPPDTYRLAAEHPDHPRGTLDGVTLEAGERRDDVVIVLRTGGRIEGHVYKPDGSPDPERRIMAEKWDTGQEFYEMATTDAAGYYAHEHLPAGRYWVQIKDQAFGPHPPASQLVQLAENETKVVDFGANTAVLHGRVTRAGKPVSEMLVLVTQSSTESFYTAGTDRDGQYQVPYLVPDTYGITVQTAYGFQKFFEGSVTVPAGVKDHQYDVALPTGVLSGTVVDPSKSPVGRASVQVQPEGAPPYDAAWSAVFQEARTDESGAFAFEGLADGRYVVTALALGHGQARETVLLANGIQAAPLVLTLKEKATVRVQPFDAETGRTTVAGLTIADEQGEYLTPPWQPHQEAGVFELSVELAAGRYGLYVNGGEGYVGAYREVEVAAGQEQVVRVPLDRGNRVHVCFVDATGHQAIPSSVALHDARGPVERPFWQGTADWFDVTLHAGPGTVEAVGPSGQAVTQPFEVPEVSSLAPKIAVKVVLP